LDPSISADETIITNASATLPTSGTVVVAGRWSGSTARTQDGDRVSASAALADFVPRSTTVKIGNQANNGDPLGSGTTLFNFIIANKDVGEDFVTTYSNNQTSTSTFYTASAVSGGTTITGSGVVQNLGQQFATQVASRLGGWIQ